VNALRSIPYGFVPWGSSCGSDTTSQHDIENGVVNIDVGFAPLRPAEFVEFPLHRAWA
jgi:phage tail sheath protein FI